MASLKIYKDDELVQELELSTEQEYAAGRKIGSDIFLDNLPGISRKHFRLFFTGTGWKVECLSSVKVTEYKGLENPNFEFNQEAHFDLPPYRFSFQPDEEIAGEGPSGTAAIPENVENSEEMDFGGEDLGIDDNFDLGPSDAPEPSLAATDVNAFDAEPGAPDDATSIKSFQGSPYLKIMGTGNRKAEYYRLEGHLWVAGSDTNAAIFLPDKKASAAHFEISKNDKTFEIIDLGSPTGTLLNGQHISTSKKTALTSGDLINIGTLTLQFELRDQAFKERVKSIPLHMYENPLVFFGEEAGVLDTREEIPKEGKAEEILSSESIKPPPPDRRKTFLMFGVVMLVLVASLFSLESQQKTKTSQPVQNLDPFQKLSQQNQKIVKETYTLARKLYLATQYELALRQLDNLHRILDIGYLDSKQIEEYCINARDLKLQRAQIKRQKNDQRRLKYKVATLLRQCSQRFGNSLDLEPARLCLSDAIQLDPNNPGISELLSKIKARIEIKATADKIASQKAEQARQGKNLYLKAKSLHDQNDFIGAMEAYESHINSGLPDPTRLVAKSKRKLSSIQKFVDQKKKTLLNSAMSQAQSSNLKKAILLARQASQVDPYDYKIATLLRSLEKELTNKMRSLYMDSVIEERFGNIEASQEKWNQIIKADVKDGEYYKKANGKLKKYGL